MSVMSPEPSEDAREPKRVSFLTWWQHGEMDGAVRKVNPAIFPPTDNRHPKGIDKETCHSLQVCRPIHNVSNLRHLGAS